MALYSWQQSPRSALERTREQDRAAGGREARIVRGTDGMARASIFLFAPSRDGSTAAAMFRYKYETRTFNRYCGRLKTGSRERMLKQAWQQARDRKLLVHRS